MTRRTTRTPLRIGGIIAPSATRRRLSKPQRQAVILANSALFRLGNTITEAQLRGWYQIPPLNIAGLSTPDIVRMINNHSLCLVAAYVGLNEVLTRRGLIIRKAGPIFNIQTLPNARKRVKGLLHEGTLKTNAAARLQNGIVRHRGIYSPLSPAELLY